MQRDKQPLIAKTNIAHEMTKPGYKNLQPKMAGTFESINENHTAMTNDVEVPNMVSIYRVTAVPRLKYCQFGTSPTPVLPENETHTTQQQQQKKTLLTVKKIPASPSEYAVGRIVGHNSYGWNGRYIVR